MAANDTLPTLTVPQECIQAIAIKGSLLGLLVLVSIGYLKLVQTLLIEEQNIRYYP